jgi:murein DD-endopeptidase MepM/ murein hydrolase activator NlpD
VTGAGAGLVRAAGAVLALGAWMSAAATTAADTGLPADPTAYVVMDPGIVYPGSIVRLRVRAADDEQGGWVELAGKRFPGIVADAMLEVYFALDIDTVPGPYELTWAVGARRGTRLVTVRQRYFEMREQEASVASTALSAADRERVVGERERLARLWRTVTPERLWGGSFRQPVGGRPGSPFGLRRLRDGQPGAAHSGMDLLADVGTLVVAANQGRVVLARQHLASGNMVVIDHGLGLYTTYSHLDSIDVALGQAVSRGEAIGRVGRSGLASRPHLHWGVRLLGARVDPITLPGVELAADVAAAMQPPPPPIPDDPEASR